MQAEDIKVGRVYEGKGVTASQIAESAWRALEDVDAEKKLARMDAFHYHASPQIVLALIREIELYKRALALSISERRLDMEFDNPSQEYAFWTALAKRDVTDEGGKDGTI